MKKPLIILLILSSAFLARSQKVDSIFFNLYTDSLKKGVHNYINVDGKLSNGKWLPLTTKDVNFTSSYGVFEGNDLILPDSPTAEKVKIRATLKSDPTVWKEITIWIKKKPDDEHLPTTEEILRDLKSKDKKKKDKKKD
jgi:hypothetical protein